MLWFLLYDFSGFDLIYNSFDSPERQLAEGIDNDSQSFNDGGGGGDGSSGHSDNDMGGDGGVAIRSRWYFYILTVDFNSKFSQKSKMSSMRRGKNK